MGVSMKAPCSHTCTSMDSGHCSSCTLTRNSQVDCADGGVHEGTLLTHMHLNRLRPSQQLHTAHTKRDGKGSFGKSGARSCHGRKERGPKRKICRGRYVRKVCRGRYAEEDVQRKICRGSMVVCAHDSVLMDSGHRAAAHYTHIYTHTHKEKQGENI